MAAVEITEFYAARLDEDEAAARDHLCINCGVPTAPLRSPIGITGYTHDGGRVSNGQWEYGWVGRRCRGSLTGAEPVQNPARRLREVEAGRAIVRDYQEVDQAFRSHGGEVMRAARDAYARCMLHRAAVFSDHPDYDPAWAPEPARG